MLTKYYDLSPSRYHTFFDFDKFFPDVAFKRESTYSVKTAEDGMTLSIDLPGAKAADLKVHTEGTLITIEGKRKGDDFKHTYTLSRTYDPTTCSATLEDGVLTLGFKKREEAKPRLIQVEVK